MPKFRKKPIVIEAMKLEWNTFHEILAWCGENAFFNHNMILRTDDNPAGQCISIKTLEGTMNAALGDYIIKGVNGEFYPCKPDIFEKTYESVENT